MEKAKGVKPLPPYKKTMGNHQITFQMGTYTGKVHNTTFKNQTKDGKTTKTKIVGPTRRETMHTREQPFPSTRRKKSLMR